jgi:SAM-dependent methyltransferase
LIEAGGVDVCGNIYALPLADDSLDGVIVKGVLEHIEFPQDAVAELERVLNPGGFVYSSIPFMQAYHPSPGDFQRFTIDGIQRLFSRFEKIDCTITRGSGSSFVWIGREYLSQLLSLNSVRLYKLWKIVFGWLLQPFKYTDVLLDRHAMAHVAASGFTFVGRKAGGGPERAPGAAGR